VALSGDEIRRRLREFAAAWGGYAGTERAEAQTFLNDLLACYGADRRSEGARFEERAGGGFMDLYWPGVCIVEMNRPSLRVGTGVEDLISEGTATGVVLANGEAIAASWRSRAGAPPSALRVRR